jgi:hypothetical protein
VTFRLPSEHHHHRPWPSHRPDHGNHEPVEGVRVPQPQPRSAADPIRGVQTAGDDPLDARLVCVVSVSRAGRVSFSWINAELSVPPKRAFVSLCWAAGCHLTEWCIEPACYQMQLQPEALLASATVLIGASAWSAGVQQALTPQ